jgi:hypothetical protein
MSSQASQLNFQNDITAVMKANGWLLGVLRHLSTTTGGALDSST